MHTLERFGRTSTATWGRLIMETGEVFFTVEQPWRFNRRFESCIPDGMYHLEPHHSAKFPVSWAFVGTNGVAHAETPQCLRYDCLFHVANHADQVQGCIGVGDSIGFFDGSMAVRNSLVSIRKLDSILKLDERRWIQVVS